MDFIPSYNVLLFVWLMLTDDVSIKSVMVVVVVVGKREFPPIKKIKGRRHTS